jgi:hypothetical protein
MTKLLALALVAVLVEPAAAGWRCAKPKQDPFLTPKPLDIKKPTVKQVKTAVTKQTFVLGADVTYALDYTGADPAEAEKCQTTLGTSGRANDATKLGALPACMKLSRGIAGTGKQTWKAVTAKKLPALVKDQAGDLTAVDKQHIIVAATTKTTAALYIGHREGTTIVLETIIAAGKP